MSLSSNAHINKGPLVLCILDGFAIGPSNEHNAIYMAQPRFLNSLMATRPVSLLQTGQEHVGLPKGQMGGSEVGHLTIGAGRVIYQDLERINQAIKSGALIDNEDLNRFIAQINTRPLPNCHVMGLLSAGGIHSHEDHFFALIEILLDNNINVVAHCFLDGRDTSPYSGIHSLERLMSKFAGKTGFKLATVTGRYYAMDRDNNIDRTLIAYDAIVNGIGDKCPILDRLKQEYENGISDEFIKPIVNTCYKGTDPEDSFLMINFRSDRIRQIMNALINKNYDGRFDKKFTNVLSMNEITKELAGFYACIFKKDTINNTFGQILAQNGLTQLRLAETEKYAHVTFFFDGGKEVELDGKQQILIPSKKVATYDLYPQMSAFEITDVLLKELHKFDFIIVNFANLDMLGHTGNMAATIEAVKIIDDCLEKICDAISGANGVLIVTSDHGNAEEMFDEQNNEPKTCHTINPVPFIIIDNSCKEAGHDYNLKKTGTLADIAPTILGLLGLPKPIEMTGSNLVYK